MHFLIKFLVVVLEEVEFHFMVSNGSCVPEIEFLLLSICTNMLNVSALVSNANQLKLFGNMPSGSELLLNQIDWDGLYCFVVFPLLVVKLVEKLQLTRLTMNSTGQPISSKV